MGVSAGGMLIQGEFIVMCYGPILLSLLFRGTACGGCSHGFLRYALSQGKSSAELLKLFDEFIGGFYRLVFLSKNLNKSQVCQSHQS